MKKNENSEFFLAFQGRKSRLVQKKKRIMFHDIYYKKDLSCIVEETEAILQTIVAVLEKRTANYSVGMFSSIDQNKKLICGKAIEAKESIEMAFVQFGSKRGEIIPKDGL